MMWVAALLLFQDVENPHFKSWSGMKVGASVKLHKIVTKSESGDAITLSETESTLTLVEATEEKAVVEVRSTLITGSTSRRLEPFKTEIPARVPAPDPSESPKLLRREEGEEDLDVGGKKIKCSWVEEETEQAGVRTITRAWKSAQIPGGVAKVETRSEGLQSGSIRILVRGFSTP